MKFDSTHERSEKLEFHRNTLSCTTILFLSTLRCSCQEDSSNIHPACLPGKGCCDRYRKIHPSTSPCIWGSRCHYCITLHGISKKGREIGEKNGCCLFSNTGIIMTSRGTGIAKYLQCSLSSVMTVRMIIFIFVFLPLPISC